MSPLLPAVYHWLEAEPGPKMILEGLKTFGVEERPGGANNPIIMEWAKEAGLDDQYVADSIPWCGLWAALIAKRAGKPGIPKKPLWALNWNQFGSPTPTPMLGDVLVFKRDTGGHVGLYVGEDDLAYHVLGGNEGDKVNIIRILKARCVGRRVPPYINRPSNIRRVVLTPSGKLSINEA